MAETPRSPQRCPIDVFKYHDYRLFLADYYAARKRRKGFSYRAFSQAAGLGAPNYLKLVIGGQRNLSPKTAGVFAQACGLGKEARDYFSTLVAFNQAETNEERTRCYRQLTAFRRYRRAQRIALAEASYHSTWYLPAVRELVLCDAFRDDPEWIASVLSPPIKPAEAKQALETLLELGLLRRDSEGRLRQQARVVSTGPETAGMHIKNYHAEMMRRATQAMDDFPARERDVSSLTMCLGPDALSRLKTRLEEFRRELIELCASDDEPRRVLQLNLQLFPLSCDTKAEAEPSSKRHTDKKHPKP